MKRAKVKTFEASGRFKRLWLPDDTLENKAAHLGGFCMFFGEKRWIDLQMKGGTRYNKGTKSFDLEE